MRVCKPSHIFPFWLKYPFRSQIWICHWIWIFSILYNYWSLSVCFGEAGAQDGLRHKHEKLNVSYYHHRNCVHDRDWIHHMILWVDVRCRPHLWRIAVVTALWSYADKEQRGKPSNTIMKHFKQLCFSSYMALFVHRLHAVSFLFRFWTVNNHYSCQYKVLFCSFQFICVISSFWNSKLFFFHSFQSILFSFQMIWICI